MYNNDIIIVYDKTQNDYKPIYISSKEIEISKKIGDYYVVYSDEIIDKKIIDIFPCVTKEKYILYATMPNINVVKSYINLDLEFY